MSLPFPSLLPVSSTPTPVSTSDFSSASSTAPRTPTKQSSSSSIQFTSASLSTVLSTPTTSTSTSTAATSVTTPRDYNDVVITTPHGSGAASYTFRPDFRTTQEIERDKAKGEHGHSHGPGHGGHHGHSHGPPVPTPSQPPSSTPSFDDTPIRPYVPIPITTSHTRTTSSKPVDHDYFGLNSDHGHAHGSGDHGHSHGPTTAPTPKRQQHNDHGHSHGGNDHGHAHGSNDHGHSHGGGNDHGHSHGPAPSPLSKRTTRDMHGAHGGDHGHSHGGSSCNDHGHSHGGHDDHGHSAHHDFYPLKPQVEDPLFPRQANRTLFGTYFPVIWNDRDARSLATYIAAKISFMCIQFMYGLWIHSLGLISSSFHTGFDAIALITALMALVLAKRKAKHPYAYGYERFEVVAGFTNACFLFFVATFLIIESFHTMYKPPEVHNDDLTLAMLGLCIDILGLILFRRYHALRQPPDLLIQSAHTTPYRGPRGHDSNMHGVFLHAVADGFSHSALLVATWIVHWQGLSLAHGLSYGIVAILIVRTSTPLFKHTGLILAQTTPEGIKNGIERAIQEIQFHDGVLECRVCHWWAVSPGITVGTLHVRVRSDADDQAILVFINQLLSKYCTQLTIQIEKDQQLTWLTQNKTG